MFDQVCVNTNEEIAGYIGIACTMVNAIVNKVPDPDQTKTKWGRWVSKILHFIALDIVTAKK